MGKAKDLPAVDFQAVVARRNPALAERLSQEGIAPQPIEQPRDNVTTPTLVAVPAPPREVDEPFGAESAARKSSRRRGVVTRADGKEAGRITVYVPVDLALRLRQHCFELDMTMSEVAGKVLVDALERHLSDHGK